MKKISIIFFLFTISIYAQLSYWKLVTQQECEQVILDDKSNIYLSNFPYLYKSTDLGETWDIIYNSQFPCQIANYKFWIDTSYFPENRLIIQQNNVNCANPPVMISYDEGLSWTELNTPGYPSTFSFTSFGDILMAADTNIYRSTDEGLTWNAMPDIPGNRKLAVDIFNNIYLGKIEVVYHPIWGDLYSELIYKSTDNGNVWDFLAASSYYTSPVGFAVTTCKTGDLILGDRLMLAGTSYRYLPDGTQYTYNNIAIRTAVVIDSVRLIVSSDIGNILFSDNNGTSWQNINFEINGGYVTGVDSLGYIYVINGNLYKSNFTWYNVFDKSTLDFGNAPIQDTSYNTIFLKNRFSFIIHLDSLRCFGNNFFVNEVSSYSIAPGDSIEIQLGFVPDSYNTFDGLLEVYSEHINARIRLNGGSPYPILQAVSLSIVFPQTPVDSSSFRYFRFFNNSGTNNLVVDTIYLSGSSIFSLIPTTFPMIAFPHDTLEVGISFTPDTAGYFFDSLIILSNTEIGEDYFLVIGRGSFLSGVLSNSGKPSVYGLYQNFPNPFNPVTSIQYSVGSTQFVKLKVYDVLGNEVATLVNEEKPAGSYTVKFDGSNLSSGIYFYEMEAGNYNEVKKLLLLK